MIQMSKSTIGEGLQSSVKIEQMKTLEFTKRLSCRLFIHALFYFLKSTIKSFVFSLNVCILSYTSVLSS